MQFGLAWHTWKPVYESIIDDFEFDRMADARARDELADLLGTSVLTPETLPKATGKRVGIAGGAPTLTDEIDRLDRADLVFAASRGTKILQDEGVQVALHVTDLDKDERTTVQRARTGLPVALHAHGDNRETLGRYVPRMDDRFVLPTTQTAPSGVVVNPGGFTDGDRAAFLAHALGAGDLLFAGWDFDDPAVGQVKRKKLRWAERLLRWLEEIRDERFSLLDGRRGPIDSARFPAV